VGNCSGSGLPQGKDKMLASVFRLTMV
jgi:hypothetical protein